MWRANLDAFWARSTNTVNDNQRSIKRLVSMDTEFGINSLIPPMGPFPLCDSLGMAPAVAVLRRSLDVGKYNRCVQWSTFRKLRSAITNAHQASVGGLGDVVGAYERKRLWISTVPTHTFFYTRFMAGCHQRVGEIVKRDEPLTVGILLHMSFILQQRWEAAKLEKPVDAEKLREIASLAVWLLVGFCVGFRGEEMPLIELSGTLKSLTYIDHPLHGLIPHFDVYLAGPTKGNRISGSRFFVPCAATTASGLNPGRWMQRLNKVLRTLGISSGRLLCRKLAQPKVSEYEEDFFSLLEEVQTTRPDLIKPDMVVRDAFGIMRSSRRGVTAHTINQGLNPEIRHAVNQWRTEREATSSSGLSLDDVYAELSALKPTVLRYSASL